jgi:acetoin utilization protein AcuB
MNVRKIGGLPVVSHGRLVGVITESDIFRAFLEISGVHEPGVRVMFDSREDEDVVALVVELAEQRGMRVASVLSMRHDRGRLAVVRLLGGDGERFIDDVLRSGHRLVSVIRTDAAAVA